MVFSDFARSALPTPCTSTISASRASTASTLIRWESPTISRFTPLGNTQYRDTPTTCSPRPISNRTAVMDGERLTMCGRGASGGGSPPQATTTTAINAKPHHRRMNRPRIADSLL